MKTAYILASYRTAGCRANKGKFKDMRPDDLAAAALSGLVERTGIDAARIDDVLLGCAFPEGEQGMNVARIAALKAGIPCQVPAQTINRFCSSGLQAIALAAERIMAGFADCIVAGGVESMTVVPMGGNKYSANPGLVNEWPEAYASMGITAELVADQYGIERQAQDVFAAKLAISGAVFQCTGQYQPVSFTLNNTVAAFMKHKDASKLLAAGPLTPDEREVIAQLVYAGVVIGLRRDDQVFVPHLRNTRKTPNEDVLRHFRRSPCGRGHLGQTDFLLLAHGVIPSSAAVRGRDLKV